MLWCVRVCLYVYVALATNILDFLGLFFGKKKRNRK